MRKNVDSHRPTDPDALVVEAWGEGVLVGSLIIMIAITAANMRRNVLLHKLIVAELVLAIGHGTFILSHSPIYGWHLSGTAVGLHISTSLHNLIAWMKIRGFFTSWGTRIYLITLLLAQPFWVLHIYANFAFFNFGKKLFVYTRPLEPLFRDPWWIFTTCFLLYYIRQGYRTSISRLIRTSPRFGIMLFFMILSIGFTILDTASVLGSHYRGPAPGVEPFWKFAFVFKCLSDTVILDDFKTTLDRVRSGCTYTAPYSGTEQGPDCFGLYFWLAMSILYTDTTARVPMVRARS
ncbi:hypothetical protein FE257_000256 [Aspergillus nanangensis]|uniref:Uncharacterized protein n=1 Tax=Aspergillus nanangensis TaxID=2582783 RepID=A0AAD4D116_ASPNN|nr:hypothetical protein FE257_000256 [Aspergillus nanangensis]